MKKIDSNFLGHAGGMNRVVKVLREDIDVTKVFRILKGSALSCFFFKIKTNNLFTGGLG